MAEKKKMSVKDIAIALGFVIAVMLVLAVVLCVTSSGHVVKEEVEVFPVEELSDSMIEEVVIVDEAVAAIEESEAEEEEEVVEEVVEPVAEPAAAPVNYSYAEPAYSAPVYTENGDGLTKSGGVNWHDGRKETWYSSNVLYHYRTGEWTVGEDGVYRDADGYVVVAASDLAQGSTVSTSFGEGKVYDSGCAAGVTDIYTAW